MMFLNIAQEFIKKINAFKLYKNKFVLSIDSIPGVVNSSS